MTTIQVVILAVSEGIVLLVAGFALGMLYRRKVAEAKIGSAESQAENIIEESKRLAESRKKEVLLEAKEENIRLKNEFEKEVRERRSEISRLERRLQQKEESVDRKNDSLERKEEQYQTKLESIDLQKAEIAAVLKKHTEELERISGYTTEQAKDILMSSIESEVRLESVMFIKDSEAKARQEAGKKAKEILGQAIQRCAVDQFAETSVSVVQLPSDEMKGRIIGREGRNIRAIESLTGIDLIIDDTPEAVILSGFDPIRREIAKVALEKLIIDGRVHPARIEEMVEKAKREVEQNIREEGDAACFETGVHGLHQEVVRLLGRMKFRTSYGQNVLKHSIEVSLLSGIIASELGADVIVAKRAGLLHDIGKSLDHEHEGTHVSLGVTLLKKYRESDIVINAVEAHHGDVEPTNIISIIVQAADAISGARPGARRETLESYVKRLQKLEEIADAFPGVEKSFAIQAGRELRLIVIPEIIDDAGLVLLARDVAKRIENEVEYPGQIKVNLIRETRAIDYAK
ncbi:MAG: ribonuclease Y [Clostridiales bacterium]|jgi:ribonuclease Y|nr:ribonuclease Y [Clostridiales bacterium]